MAPDMKNDALVSDLVALGRGIPGPTPAAGLTATVLARLSDSPTPVVASTPERLLRRAGDALAPHRRRVVVLVTALLLALLATPPVRATVADWFGFAGVIVRQDPTPAPSTAPPPPALGPTIPLDEAKALVAFDPVVPADLGAPQGVQMSSDRRVLTMSWTDEGGRALRLDQFDGRLDFTFQKTHPGSSTPLSRVRSHSGSTSRTRSSYSTATAQSEPRRRAWPGTL